MITEHFLLQNKTAIELYEQYAKDQPILDYHCHIVPREIAENRSYENLAQVWLGGDHYKWRMIRSNGVPEEEITGSADDRVKFQRFAEALPKAIGNPMYHWSHLELKRYFGYDGVLNGDTAEEVWQLCNEKLHRPDMSVRGIIEKSNVEVIGTTDDPTDDLCWHERLTDFSAKVVPSFRPDKALNMEKEGFADYIRSLEAVCGTSIETVADVKSALSARLDYFCAHGCRAADHGLDYIIYDRMSEAELNAALTRVLNGETVTQREADSYKTELLLHMGREYCRRDMVMQLHYGAIRNTNTLKFRKLGPDTGFDCIRTRPCGEALIAFWDALEQEHALPKTIVYSLNPFDNAMLDTYIGAFQGTEAAGKLQHGAAWWFNDTKRGMEEQLRSLADLSLLGNFVGMLTDSRSFLSYTRHEYFRRILCNLIGMWVENGEYPHDEKALKQIIEGICYTNAKNYFRFG